jgi:hypothetical protein
MRTTEGERLGIVATASPIAGREIDEPDERPSITMVVVHVPDEAFAPSDPRGASLQIQIANSSTIR